MIKVGFPDKVPDEKLEFAVIVARHDGKWVLCKHRKRDTYECPGGHRETGENIESTARRELWEETGAESFSLTQIGPYSVEDGEKTTYGMFYYAEIEKFGELPELEIERIELMETQPTAWSYPQIQPYLLEKVREIYSL
ncbi:MAG: NUDIX domain-containing protein [Oscillospiraceae bacterium]|nr:NUDIX domain-containing protein [Oscillospiraceae bacterium]